MDETESPIVVRQLLRFRQYNADLQAFAHFVRNTTPPRKDHPT